MQVNHSDGVESTSSHFGYHVERVRTALGNLLHILRGDKEASQALTLLVKSASDLQTCVFDTDQVISEVLQRARYEEGMGMASPWRAATNSLSEMFRMGPCAGGDRGVDEGVLLKLAAKTEERKQEPGAPALVLVDKSLNIQLWGHRATQFFGIESEDAEGKDLREVLPFLVKTNEVGLIEQALSVRVVCSQYRPYATHTGAYGHLDATYQPYYGDGGAVSGVLAAFKKSTGPVSKS